MQLESKGAPASRAWPQAFLCVLFFLSGFPALVYQIVWQRALFSIYGVNIESVTTVVTAFMLGLGFGSLGGGFVSKR
jgi:spermidine synthase